MSGNCEWRGSFASPEPPSAERMEEDTEATNRPLVHMVYAYHPFLTLSTSITRIERTRSRRSSLVNAYWPGDPSFSVS